MDTAGILRGPFHSAPNNIGGKIMVLRNRIVLIFAIAFVFSLLSVQAFAAKNAADVTVTFEKGSFAVDESVLVRVTISNPNKGSIRLLRWLTPVDGVDDDLFEVMIDGLPAEYIGKHFKRSAPTDKDYIILRGGESIDTTVDLAGFYDLSRSGYYSVNYRAASYNLTTKDANFIGEEDKMASAAVAAWIEGRETKIPLSEPEAVIGSTSFTGCTTSRQSDLNTARNNAVTYSAGANSYLQAGTVSSRYTTWFGTYQSSRYNTVRTHFSSILNAMDMASVTFNCTCTSSAYAYVYSNQPYTIYLCNAFWSAPALGTDSKAGTLVHEMSHFNVVAGTSDYAYGQTAAKRLATTNPKRAINNADNHEYFAENTPSLP